MEIENQGISNHKKILWITVPFFSYISEKAESSLVDIRSVYKHCFDYNSKIKTLIFILFSYLKLDYFFWGSWKKEMDNYDIIVVRDGMPTYIVNSIRKRWRDKKLVVYFGNIIRDSEQKKYFQFSKKVADEIFTFEKEDSKNYSIPYARMPFTYEVIKPEEQGESVYFFGRDKGRKEQLIEIKGFLERAKIFTDFTIVENKSQFKTYREIFEQTIQSKAIIELIESRQNSFSLRVLEALFLEKKIITNNLDMRNTDFYLADNIFIMGLDDINVIDEWYSKPYQNIPEYILYRYSLDCFGERILMKVASESTTQKAAKE
jgi:hypothetical protein